jgi:hypothetical protein
MKLREPSRKRALLIAIPITAVIVVSWFVSAKVEEKRLGYIGYKMMRFSNYTDLPQHSRATDLSIALRSTASGKAMAYLVTYAKPLPEETIAKWGFKTATTDTRERLNEILRTAEFREGTIAPITSTDRILQREFRAEEGTRTHAMIPRENGSVVLHFLEMEFDDQAMQNTEEVAEQPPARRDLKSEGG